MDDKTVAIAPIDLVSTKFACWKCEKLTLVSCIIAADLIDFGERLNTRVRLNNIETLPSRLQDALVRKNPNIRKTGSRTAGHAYLANNCQHCGALQGDFYLHSEPDGPFFAFEFPEESDIERIADEGEFEVDCGYSY